MMYRVFFIFTLFCGIVHLKSAKADEIYTFVIKKQEEKSKIHWNLSDWLQTKEKMHLMDLWLYLHSPSPYEFLINVQGGTYSAGHSSFGVWQGRFAAYASIFGLQTEFESQECEGPTWSGLFNLRIFGTHVQSTHITLQYGIKNRNLGLIYRNSFWSVISNVYLSRVFGLEGMYRKYLKSQTSQWMQGSRYEVGAFIDFSFVQVRALLFWEPLNYLTSGNTSVQEMRKGVTAGIQLFF